MRNTAAITRLVRPFSLKDAPALIERLFPAQKISAESQKERKANAGQTLTTLGSYWKGRKPLILVKACVLASLLPATGDDEKDLAIFETLEKIMGIDDDAFLYRAFLKSSEWAQKAIVSGQLGNEELFQFFKPASQGKSDSFDLPQDEQNALCHRMMKEGKIKWRGDIGADDKTRLSKASLSTMSYLDKVDVSLRPEALPDYAFEGAWDLVNAHVGTDAHSISELIDQLGIMRFGNRPKIGDTFCGGGSIPFEAARLGCDVYASDLNPIACMLTWGALNIIGGSDQEHEEIKKAQMEVSQAVDLEITSLGVEHDDHGNRAKVFLYCLETRCPQTGWMVPMAPSWVISKTKNVIATLIPNHAEKRFEIEIIAGVSDSEMKAAAKGTVQNNDLVYVLDGEEHRTPIKTIRGDYRLSDGATGNRLRKWGVGEFKPRPDDIFQERLYAIQWIARDSFEKGRPETFFAGVTEMDLAREAQVQAIVAENLTSWQDDGFVPDMLIEPGDNTSQPIWERGWTYWHHLFTPRQLHQFALVRGAIVRHQRAAELSLFFARSLDANSKLTRWDSGVGQDRVANTFSNQALNTLANYAVRSYYHLMPQITYEAAAAPKASFLGSVEIGSQQANRVESFSHIFITDPPYADAVNYHEITEFFIAWLRKNPPKPLDEWEWDSRRLLAIKGDGQEFRTGMVEAYKAMADHMPDNGLQIVMFTHQSGKVWADMASIFWGAGLQVIADWYIATETASELKKGGYVQGTHIIVLRKRASNESGYKDEIVHEVRAEVAKQIETMTGLNQTLKGKGRIENLFEDADLQMAGYAAALRVLTSYTKIDGVDMTREALRPRQKNERGIVDEIIEFAVQVANEHMVPEGMDAKVWERLTGSERFYLKMLDIETAGIHKLDNYQNFAKAFRVADYTVMMANLDPNKARLKTATEFKKAEFTGSEFAGSVTRAVLYALYELENDTDGDEVLAHLADLVTGYLGKRDDLAVIAAYVALKRQAIAPEEASAGRVLAALIQNQRLG